MPYHLLVKKNAQIKDTLDLITKAINVYSHSPFIIELTKKLNPHAGSKYDFIKRLFDYVCKNVRYQLDRVGDEEVWSPEKTVREGVGDCKKMTVLIASVLKCAGIEPVLKHVYYANELHTHIYVIVPFPDLNSYLTVDPVNHQQWNTEVKYSKGSLNYLNGKKMNLHMMGRQPDADGTTRYMFKATTFEDSVRGIEEDLNVTAGMGCPMGSEALYDAMSMEGIPEYIEGIEDEVIEGIGKRGGKLFKPVVRKPKAERKAIRKDRRKKVFKVLKKVNNAPMRGSFLLLVRSNVFRLANRMAKVWIANPAALKKMWEGFGGKPDKLRDAIKAGAWKSLKPQINGIGAMEMEEAPTVGQLEDMEINGIGFPPAIAAAIAASTPIVLATIKIVGKSKNDADTEVITEEQEQASNSQLLSEATQQAVEQGADAYNTSVDFENQAIDESEAEEMPSEEDEIVEGIGAAYDYIDMMGRKRKKAKKAKKTKKVKKKKAKINKADIKTLSTLAQYGTNKILKGQVKVKDMNELPHDIPKTAAGSFGLTEINSLSDLATWFKGTFMISFMVALGLNLLIANSLIIGSLLYLTSKHTVAFIKFAFSKINPKKNKHYESKI